jgi:hypothetical protein
MDKVHFYYKPRNNKEQSLSEGFVIGVPLGVQITSTFHVTDTTNTIASRACQRSSEEALT